MKIPMNPMQYDHLKKINYPFLHFFYRCSLVKYKGSKKDEHRN